MDKCDKMGMPTHEIRALFLVLRRKGRTFPLQNPNSAHYSSSAAAVSMAGDQPKEEDPDELLCSSLSTVCSLSSPITNPNPNPDGSLQSSPDSSHIERAWAHWKNLGAPKLVVAPMVDNSELPFRMLCRKYGAQAAYTPMLHSRIFSENDKYRSMEFTTCKVKEQTACSFFSFFLFWLQIFSHGFFFV